MRFNFIYYSFFSINYSSSSLTSNLYNLVGPTAASVVLSYVYLLFAVFWMLSAVFVLSPILNAIFGVCALPLLIAVFSIAFHHT